MNKNLLLAAIAKKGSTCAECAEKTGISNATFSLKMNGKRDFYRHEITLLASFLELSLEDIISIFFCELA